jgi:NADH-quinone oxidoreductase subunit B
MYHRTVPIVPAERQKDATFEYIATRKDELIGWARKFSIFPYPFVTACCAMEFMAVSASAYDTDRFGAALPRFSPRQSDLLWVVGTISQRQAPVLKRIYEQMMEPKYVMAFLSSRSTAPRLATLLTELWPRAWPTQSPSSIATTTFAAAS